MTTPATQELDRICSQPDLDASLSTLLPYLGRKLECDRVFLYLRSPQDQRGRVPFCWCKDDQIPEIYDPAWKPEPPSLTQDDPMFAAAVEGKPSIFIEDVKTTSPEILNQDFERETFGHRALIHAHLVEQQTLWGILQPCVFQQPRIWNKRDRALIHHTVKRLTPLAKQYVTHYYPNP
jgi:GAF domain-containing protein